MKIHKTATHVGTLLFSILIAIILWEIVLGSRNIEVSKDIPLELVTDPGLVSATNFPEHVTFRLAGPKAFLRGILDRPEEPIRVDLRGEKSPLVTYRFFSDQIHLPIGLKVLAIQPSVLMIRLEPLKRKEVSVKLEVRGTPPEGFRVSKLSLQPDTIVIQGAESHVSDVSEITTVPIDLSTIKGRTERIAQLDLSHKQVQIEGESPHVFIEMEALTSYFRVRNVDIHVVAARPVRLQEKSVTVFLRAARGEEIHSLDRSRIYGVVDVSNRKPGIYTELVRVVLPQTLGLVKVVPDRVQLTID